MTLQQLIEDMGEKPRSYSGRGMYGKECLGVTVSDLLNFVFDLGVVWSESELGFETQYPKMRWDSMGRDYIVYFPEVPYDGEDDEAEDEDED